MTRNRQRKNEPPDPVEPAIRLLTKEQLMTALGIDDKRFALYRERGIIMAGLRLPGGRRDMWTEDDLEDIQNRMLKHHRYPQMPEDGAKDGPSE